MALSQVCWQSQCMNQGEMKGTVPFRKCLCQDQSLAWSQSSPPPWQDELGWTSSLCCPGGPCRGQAYIPKCPQAWFSTGRGRAKPGPSGELSLGLGRPGQRETSIPKQDRGALPPCTQKWYNRVVQNSHDHSQGQGGEPEPSLSGRRKASEKVRGE